MKKLLKVFKNEKNKHLTKDDLVNMFDSYVKDDKFNDFINEFDTTQKFTYKKFDRYVEKKKAEEKEKKEKDELKQQIEDLERAAREAKEKLSAMNAKKNHGLFVRELESKHNKTKSIEVITQKNLDQMKNKSGKNISEPIDVPLALKILKDYISDNDITINGNFFVNVLADNGHHTFATLKDLEEFDEIDDITSEEYKLGRIFAISIVSMQDQ